MKRKHTRIIALIIVIAVVVTTVMSTVLAFADETDTDYDDSSYSENRLAAAIDTREAATGQ